MSRIPDDAPVYSMAVAEQMTGLTRRRIRYYEAMGLLEPARTPGNRRLYSLTDIRRLAEIKRLLEEGLDLRAIAGLKASGRWEPGDRQRSPARAGGGALPAKPLVVPELGRYEDARARLLGRGPAGSVDRLYPGDAGRLVRGRAGSPQPGAARSPGPGPVKGSKSGPGGHGPG